MQGGALPLHALPHPLTGDAAIKSRKKLAKMAALARATEPQADTVDAVRAGGADGQNGPPAGAFMEAVIVLEDEEEDEEEEEDSGWRPVGSSSAGEMGGRGQAGARPWDMLQWYAVACMLQVPRACSHAAENLPAGAGEAVPEAMRPKPSCCHASACTTITMLVGWMPPQLAQVQRQQQLEALQRLTRRGWRRGGRPRAAQAGSMEAPLHQGCAQHLRWAVP